MKERKQKNITKEKKKKVVKKEKKKVAKKEKKEKIEFSIIDLIEIMECIVTNYKNTNTEENCYECSNLNFCEEFFVKVQDLFEEVSSKKNSKKEV